MTTPWDPSRFDACLERVARDIADVRYDDPGALMMTVGWGGPMPRPVPRSRFFRWLAEAEVTGAVRWWLCLAGVAFLAVPLLPAFTRMLGGCP